MNRYRLINVRKLHKTVLAYFLHIKSLNEDELRKKPMKFGDGITLTKPKGKYKVRYTRRRKCFRII